MDIQAENQPFLRISGIQWQQAEQPGEAHLSQKEWQRSITAQSDAAASFTDDRCIHQVFERQVEYSPNAIAVLYEDKETGNLVGMTYRELNRKANQLARYLQGIGVGPETLVGICVERSTDMIIGVLGILKAGGAYVPLDPTYPQERLAFMLADAQTQVLLTQARARENIMQVAHSMNIVYLDNDWDHIGQENEENPDFGVLLEHAAYVIYTSGSTGTPKGVVIQHRSLANYSKVASTAYTLKQDDRVLQFATLNFDASAEEIYATLVSGATLVLRSQDMRDSTSFFCEKCADWAITVLDLPTAYWHELTRSITEGIAMLPPSVRLVIIGGEKASPTLLAQWQHHVPPDVQLVNTYGPTEATIVTTMYNIPALGSEDRFLQEIPIGRPIAHAEVYLLDQQRQIVPVGVPGELYIGGVGLAREYLNRPALTRERFIPHPFRDEAEARLYKTGDLACYLPSGDIQFLGRVDQQVKIRGYRIEPGEIEAVLEHHAGIREAVVQVREDENGGKQLIAYIVPQREQSLTTNEIRRFLQEQLPDYMIPAAFVLLEALPLSPSGKVDRLSLPAPKEGRPEQLTAYIAPCLPVHHKLVQIWEELFAVRPVGIRDNFFDLGGHSLLAVRLVDRIEQVCGKRITPTTLLAGPTIEQLGQVLEQPHIASVNTLPETTPASKEPQSLLGRTGKMAASMKAVWVSTRGKQRR